MTLKQTKESNDCHATAMFQGGIEIGKLNLSFKKFVSTLNCKRVATFSKAKNYVYISLERYISRWPVGSGHFANI